MFEQRLAELQSTDAEIRKKAVEWLQKRDSDERAFQPLLSMLNDSDFDVRAAAIRTLVEKYANFPICEPLLAKLDDDIKIAGLALWAFRRLKDPCAVDRLIQFVQTHKPPADESYNYWEHALEALECIATEQALTAVQAAKEREIPDLINRYIANLSSPDPKIRRFVINRLGKMRAKEAVEPMLHLLKDPDASVRHEVVANMQWLLSNPESLFPLLWDSDERVVQQTIYSLRNMRATRAIPELIALLKTRRRPEPPKQLDVWGTLIFTLKGFETPDALAAVAEAEAQNPPITIDQLIARLASEDIDTHLSTISRLSLVNDPRILDLLITRLYDPDSRIKEAAFFSLFPVHVEPRILEHILLFLTNPDARVREKLVLMLCKLKSPETVAPLAELLTHYHPRFVYGFDVWKHIVETLFEIGTPAAHTAIIENAAQLLQHDDDRFKANGIYNLSYIKDAQSITLLQGVLALYSPSPDADIDLWQTTVDRLEVMGTPEALALVDEAKRQHGK